LLITPAEISALTWGVRDQELPATCSAHQIQIRPTLHARIDSVNTGKV
jgi:hypothetical protein